MPRYLHSLLIPILFLSFSLKAQVDFYNHDHIADIHLIFKEENWQSKLDSIFIATGGLGRMTADVVIDGETYKNVGVRYKGYSSWNEGELKNPYNIELDYTIKNQNHNGFTKIKLSNVIHDPSFIREVLAYEIVRKYMPASHASYAMLYVNDKLIGLYTNVESVDKIFASHYYPDNKNTFFKGDPDELQYPFGQNANLAHTHGDDSINYIPYYKLESDYGWKDLYDFIYVLNELPDSVDKVLNTDRALWMSALNYSIVNLDSYIGFAQNYYMYKDNNGRFNPIIWDLNMSFGSFRISDGSNHFQGLTIAQCKTLDPLQHLTFSISPRPLMTNLFKNNTYKRMYLAHMRTIIDENLRNNWYYTRGVELQNLIRNQVQTDTNKFYSDTDFEENLDKTVGGSGGMIEYPGLKDLMEGRMAYLDTYTGFSAYPLISEITASPAIAEQGKDCWITANLTNTNHAVLAYRYNTDDVFTKVTMFDDGAHQDGNANDGVYGASITVSSPTVQYYLYAENDSAASFSPERAEYVFYSLNVAPEKGDIYINEINVSSLNSSWMELLNNTNKEISLKGINLVSKNNSWTFPDTILAAHSFLIVKFGSSASDPMNCNLQISSLGGEFSINNSFGRLIDKSNFPVQVEGKSFGRYPNAYGPFVYMSPTYSRNNYIGSTPQNGFICYPNPAGSELFIEFSMETSATSIEIFTLQGQKVLEENIISNNTEAVSMIRKYDVSKLACGAYLICLRNKDAMLTKKFFKY